MARPEELHHIWEVFLKIAISNIDGFFKTTGDGILVKNLFNSLLILNDMHNNCKQLIGLLNLSKYCKLLHYSVQCIVVNAFKHNVYKISYRNKT